MNAERQKLIIDLKRIANSNYQLNDNENAMEFVHIMLHYVGDTDPYLRDDLIYSTFRKWISEKKYLNNEQLIEIINILLDDNHLFFHIGHKEDDTAFTRTFSVLLIEVFLWWNRNTSYLPMDLFIKIKNSLVRYYQEEKDLRGYLDDKGWIHGAAHGADAMCQLIRSKEADNDIRLNVLDSLKRILSNGEYFLSNEEDERMARVVFLMIMHDLLPILDIKKWIENLEKNVSSKYSREQYITRINTKNFIRCLYFSLMHQEKTKDITDFLFLAEEKLNKFL